MTHIKKQTKREKKNLYQFVTAKIEINKEKNE